MNMTYSNNEDAIFSLRLTLLGSVIITLAGIIGIFSPYIAVTVALITLPSIVVLSIGFSMYQIIKTPRNTHSKLLKWVFIFNLLLVAVGSMLVYFASNDPRMAKESEEFNGPSTQTIHKEVDKYLNKKSTNKQIEHAVDEYLAKKNLQDEK